MPLATGAQGEPTAEHRPQRSPRSLERTCRCARSRRRTPPAPFSLVRAPHHQTRRLPHTARPAGVPHCPTAHTAPECGDAPPPDSTAAHHHQPSGEPMAHADRMHSWARHAHTSLKRESARVDAVSRTASEECGCVAGSNYNICYMGRHPWPLEPCGAASRSARPRVCRYALAPSRVAGGSPSPGRAARAASSARGRPAPPPTCGAHQASGRGLAFALPPRPLSSIVFRVRLRLHYTVQRTTPRATVRIAANASRREHEPRTYTGDYFLAPLHSRRAPPAIYLRIRSPSIRLDLARLHPAARR